MANISQVLGPETGEQSPEEGGGKKTQKIDWKLKKLIKIVKNVVFVKLYDFYFLNNLQFSKKNGKNLALGLTTGP